MKNLRCTWKGITPLIMHSCKGVNPLHPITIQIKKLTSKRNCTEEDLALISDLEWESGLYYNDEIGVYVPAENIEATIRDGAKARKKGKDIARAFNVLDMCVPLDFGESLAKEQLKADLRFRDVRAHRVKQARVIRTCPRFNMWAITFRAAYDEKILDLETIENSIEFAGSYIGICELRPKYGRFIATIEELD